MFVMYVYAREICVYDVHCDLFICMYMLSKLYVCEMFMYVMCIYVCVCRCVMCMYAYMCRSIWM